MKEEYTYNALTGKFDIVNSDTEVDGGFANSVYQTPQLIDGGSA